MLFSTIQLFPGQNVLPYPTEKKNFDDFLRSVVIQYILLCSVPYILRVRLFIKNYSARKKLSIDIYYEFLRKKN